MDFTKMPDINTGHYSCKTEMKSVFGHCRCCLEEGHHHHDLSKLNFADGRQENFCDAFLDCFNLFLSTSSNLSSLICSSCVYKLREAQEFKSLVMRTERQLMEAEHQLLRTLQNCGDKQMVIAPVAKQKAVDKHKEEDYDDNVDDSIPCNLADIKFEVEDGVLEVTEEDKEKGEVEKDYNVEVSIPCNLADMKFEVEDGVLEVPAAEEKEVDKNEEEDYDDNVGDSISCNLADMKFEVEDGVLEVKQYMEDPLSIPDETPNEVPLTDLLTTKTLMDNTRTFLYHCNATLFKSKNKAGFPCFYCNALFDNFDVLEDHQTLHSKYSLKLILEEYTEDNLVVYADVTDLKCTICDMAMKSLRQLKTHLIHLHDMVFLSYFMKRIVPFKLLRNKYFNCQICSYNFGTFTTMERHMSTHFRNCVCDECGAAFVTNSRLRSHKDLIHKLGTFPCKICRRVFVTLIKYKRHFDRVHKVKCNKCSKRFTDYFDKKKHMIQVHGDTPILMGMLLKQD